jgi:hypothetical protein
MEREDTERCHADRDGDCDWGSCPQKVSYQSICPLDEDIEWDDEPTHDPYLESDYINW